MSNDIEHPGLSLTDLGPQRELIKVGNSKLAVYGISAEGIFVLFARYPELQQWATTGRAAVSNLAAKAPEAISAIIAAGCHQPNNELAEQVARSLPVETQIDVLEAIARLTFKNGFGPFVERIIGLSAQVRLAASHGKAPATISPQTSRP